MFMQLDKTSVVCVLLLTNASLWGFLSLHAVCSGSITTAVKQTGFVPGDTQFPVFRACFVYLGFIA